MAENKRGSWGQEEDTILKNALLEGHSIPEIAEQLGYAKNTVVYHAKKLEVYNPSGKGGQVSSSIPINDICGKAKDHKVEEDRFPMCAVTRKLITMGGIGTRSTYTLDSSTKIVTIDKGGLGIEVSFKEFNDFIDELRGVQKKLTMMNTTEVW